MKATAEMRVLFDKEATIDGVISFCGFELMKAKLFGHCKAESGRIIGVKRKT